MAPRIRIGVHVVSAGQALVPTLLATHETTARPFELTVLVDPAPGEADALAKKLSALAPFLCQPAAVPGAAGSFNTLLQQPADIYVFLEAGALPGPDWLDHLLAALQADPAHGLAGPSTNAAWNEQACAACGPTASEVARAAERLAAEYSGVWRSMAPLHSLADFCLAVRREVVEAVGAADTAYGRGPCWEMDFSARAARAGFLGIWARAAFVRRAATPAWRTATEAALLETSKRLYQDRFCGRRATAPHAPYHASCRGDACPDFAPPARTRIAISLPPVPAAPEPAPDLPRISCIMPTRGRAAFVAQSIRYFDRQDYPNRELIIVYEDEADLPENLDTPGVRTLKTRETSIGGKRESGARAAAGEFIAHWDDDDWYAPERLSRQATPLRQGLTDMSGLNDQLFMVMPVRQFWSVTRELFGKLFVENVSGGTLMVRRDVWQRFGPYPSTSLREDIALMTRAMRAGLNLCRLPGRDLSIYVRHTANTWKFIEGTFLHPEGWSQVPEPACLTVDRDFYFGQARRAPGLIRQSAGPLVSCIMPTADRRVFVPGAIRQFLSQDYLERELIVIDDGQDCVADLIPDIPAVRYVRLDRRASIGAKRNIACELARGRLIAHWDDDDWRGSAWLGSQARTALDQGADLCGLRNVLFYAPETRRAWRYVYEGREPWVCGGTFCYTRDLWQRNAFSDIDIGEDSLFVWSAAPKLVSVNPNHHLYVATIHAGNTSPKVTGDQRWKPYPAAQVDRLMMQFSGSPHGASPG